MCFPGFLGSIPFHLVCIALWMTTLPVSPVYRPVQTPVNTLSAIDSALARNIPAGGHADPKRAADAKFDICGRTYLGMCCDHIGDWELLAAVVA